MLLAMKLFAKDLGVPDSTITDASAAETSREVRAFCINIDVILKTLEEGVTWANLDELCIGLMKSYLGKGIKSSDCPTRVWEHCVEKRSRINSVNSRDNLSFSGVTPMLQ